MQRRQRTLRTGWRYRRVNLQWKWGITVDSSTGWEEKIMEKGVNCRVQLVNKKGWTTGLVFKSSSQGYYQCIILAPLSNHYCFRRLGWLPFKGSAPRSLMTYYILRLHLESQREFKHFRVVLASTYPINQLLWFSLKA